MPERQPKVHSLKCWPTFFRAVKSGAKTFEIRKNDRDYQVGDFLELHEYEPLMDRFTDEPPLMVEVTYALSDQPFVPEGMVCMGIKPATQPDGCEWEKRQLLDSFGDTRTGYHCPKCGFLSDVEWPFCPKCGAKMTSKRLGE